MHVDESGWLTWPWVRVDGSRSFFHCEMIIHSEKKVPLQGLPGGWVVNIGVGVTSSVATLDPLLIRLLASVSATNLGKDLSAPPFLLNCYGTDTYD